MYRPFRRLHLFEIHEQPWCPRFVRDGLTEWLRVLWERTGPVPVVSSLVQRAMAESGADRIVDLCSGASGPVVPLQKELHQLGADIPVLVTDLFPNSEAMQRVERETTGHVQACLEPVDATSLPSGLQGFRTLFNSFHHFRPEQGRAMLEDAYRKRQPIGIFELTEPTVQKIVLSFPASFVSVFVFLLWMKPRRLSWWFFTWVIPVLPFVIAWDGMVSHIRSYTPSELIRLTDGLLDPSFRWSTGSLPAQGGAVDVSFLLGIPLASRPKAASATSSRR